MTSERKDYIVVCKYLYKIGISSLLFGALFLNSGCSAPQLPTYPVKQIDHYQHTLFRDGLQIAVDPMFDSQENNTYFGVDLFQENILPVFVMVKNLNSNGSIVVHKNKISLNGLTNDHMEVNDEVNIVDASNAMALNEASAFLGSTPLMLVALSQVSDLAEIKRNFKTKAFQTQTLSTGKQSCGFVYFRLPEKIKNVEKLSIRIEMMNLQEKSNQIYQIPFVWKGKKNDKI